MSKSRHHILIALLLAFATAVFFWPVIIGQAWLPRGGGDAVSFIFPMYRFAAQSLASGQLPLWNPYQYAGYPFLADNQSGLFYPPNLILFLLNPEFSYRAIQWHVILHIWFSGVAMAFCLRHLTPKRPFHWSAALLGGLAFMFSDLFITHIGNPNLNAVAAWLPFAFLGLHRAIIAKSGLITRRWAIFGGVALGLGTLAGHGQMTFLIALLLGSYALFMALSQRTLRPFLSLTLLAIIAIGLAAISLLPAAAAVPHTVRGTFSADQASNFSLPLQGLVGLLAPNFFGRGEVAFWASWPRVEYGYVGVLTLLLAVAAPFLRRRRLTLFLILGGLLFLLLALGDNTPLYPLLLRLLPIFPFQVPARFILLLDFCLATLAATSLHDFLHGDRLSRVGLAAVGLVAISATAVLLWQLGEWGTAVSPQRLPQLQQSVLIFAALALATLILIFTFSKLNPYPQLTIDHWQLTIGNLFPLLLALDLILLGAPIEREPNNPTLGFPTNSPALTYLQNDPGLHRLDIATNEWQPSLPQIEQLNGLRGVFNPLDLSLYNVYVNSVGFRGSPLYNLLGVKYIIGGKGDPPGDTSFIIPVFDQDPRVTVYLNTRALPRLLVLHNAEVVDSAQAAFDRTHRADFDPQQLLILQSGEPLSQPIGQSSIALLRYDLNRITVELTTDRPAYLLLSDIYHPGWQATLNDAQTPIHLANYALRAVAVPTGTHTIDMRFTPQGLWLGLTLTLLTFISIILLWRNYQIPHPVRTG